MQGKQIKAVVRDDTSTIELNKIVNFSINLNFGIHLSAWKQNIYFTWDGKNW